VCVIKITSAVSQFTLADLEAYTNITSYGETGPCTAELVFCLHLSRWQQ